MSENNSLQNNNGKPIQLNHNMEILDTQTPSNKVDIFKIDQQSSNYGNNDFQLNTEGLVLPKPNITLDKIVVNSHQDTIKVSKVIGESEDDNKKQKLDRRIVKFIIGGWLFASSLISMSLCHRLDSSRSKKIEPFLRRDELSPVGWIVPSIPNIVIDPKLSRNKMIMPCLSVGSDILCTIVVAGFAVLIVWTGVRDMQGFENGAFWEFN